MKNTITAKLSLIASSVLLLWTSSGQAQTALNEYLYDPATPTTWRDAYSGGEGCQFTVGPTNVVVSHLGYFSSNSITGLNASHYVGIYAVTGLGQGQLLDEVLIPAGTAADAYTNQFYWMPLDPPFLLQSNATYAVMAQQFSGDGDLWGDAFYTTFNPFFLGQTTNNPLLAPQAIYGPGNGQWPVTGWGFWSASGSNSTYQVESLANLPIDYARVNVQSTNIVSAPGPLTVVGFGTGQTPITYQWWQPGSPPTQVAGQTSPNLTFANATPANTGVYFLTASNALGGEQSPDVFISVVANPVGVKTGATNAVIFNNYPATFTVVVTGTPPVTVQWYSNSIPDPNSITTYGSGATFTNSYSVIAQTPDNGNIYTMVVSNNISSVAHTATNSATLTVTPNFGYPEHILHPPPGTNIFYASSPGTTHGNNGNGGSGGDIVIGNANVLITHLGFCAVGLPLNGIPALEANHHIEIYTYPGLALQGYVVVTNGTPASSAYDGYLWVALNPPLLLSNNTTYVLSAENLINEDYWGDTYIPSGWDSFITPGAGNNAVYGGGYGNTWPTAPNSGHYGSQIYSGPNMGDLVVSNQIFALSTPNNITVGAGGSVTLTGYVNGPPPVTVQWYQNGVAMSGQTNINLTINNIPPGTSTYTLLATNTQTGIGAFSIASTVVAYSSPVVVSETPETYTNIGNVSLMTLYAGASPSFSLRALGAGTLAYQWFTNGVAVGNATNAAYQASNIQAGGATNVSCIITNSSGSATNIWSATLVPAPTNSVGAPAAYPQSVLALNPIGYWRLNEPDCCGGENGPNDGSIATDYSGGNNGVYTNMSLGWAGYNPTLDPSDTSAQFGEVDEISGDYGDSEAYGIAGVNFASPSGTSVAFTVEAWVAGYTGAQYDAGIVTLGWGGGGEQFDLDEGNDTAPASHAFRFLMRDAGGTTHLVGSLLQPAGITTWYHLAAVVDEVSNQIVSFYTNGVLCGTAVVARGSGVLSATNPVLGITSQMSIGSRMAAEVGNYSDQFYGNINDVAVYNYALTPSQVYNQYLEGASIPPNLNPAPPATYIMSANLPATIAAIASGPPPLGYQWIDTGHGNAVLQSGITNGTILNASFITSSASPSLNNDTLELVVTNGFGSTNVPVLVTVASAPAINTNLPPQVLVGQGQAYTYIVGAAGDTNLVYQWYENSSKVSGATNIAFTPPTTVGSTNTVDVVVTNGYGSVTSTISMFMVVALPNTTLAGAISALQPVGYWPMHEVEPVAPGDIETNYGTLGVLGTGYYPDWMTNYGQFLHQIPGAIVSDPDTAMFFNQNFFAGGSYTNGLYIPNVAPAATLNPPFTVECWVMEQTNNAEQNTIWGQTAYEGLNAGGENGGGSANGIGPRGIRLYWNATAPNGIKTNSFTIYTYNNSTTLNTIITMTNNIGINTDIWYHVVVTCDAQTNFSLYTNGALVATAPGVGLYSPDYWNPLTIGTSKGFSQANACGIDEFAVYTNALSGATILNDYQTGINPSPATSYFQTISNNQPAIYYRMDSPTYAAPSPSTWPTMYNYGSVLGNGVYTPGTVTGVLPGPNTLYTGETNQGANVAVLGGVSSFGDAGYNPVWDPSPLYATASNAFSVTCMFRGNPADNRYQTMFGHHDGTWKVDLTANAAGDGGVPGSVLWAFSGSVNSTNNCNDGKWHQMVGTYTPGPLASPGTLRLYVDGQFNNFNANVSSNGITTVANTFDILMGAVPDYTNNPAGPGRQFDGELCDVAIFTNVLTPAQVQSLYSAAGGLVQPLSMPISGQLPVTWNYVGPNLGNNMGATNLMNLYAGASPSFLVTAYGAPGGSYQWFTNGVAVGFGTNNILTLPNVQSAFTTYCIATNSMNSVTSVVWSASIVADPDPVGSFSQTIMSDNPVAYWRLNESAGSTIALDYAGGANGQYGAQTTNGLPGAPIVSAAPEFGVAMNPNASGNASGSVTNLGVIMVTNTCTFVVWELPTAVESSYYGAFVNRSTANFSGAGLSSQPNWGAYWNNAGNTYGYASGLGIPLNSWYMGVVEIFPEYSVLATFTNSSAGYVLSSYVTNSTVSGGNPVESFLGGNEIGCDNGTSLTRIFHGELNELAIFNYDLSPAQLSALVNASTNGALTTASIESQPQSAVVVLGATTNFTVGASTFLPPLSYQWYFNTANSYVGAAALANGLQANGSWATNVATARLTVTNVTSGALGYYYVAVHNSAGTVNSAIAALTTGLALNPTNIVFGVTNNQLYLSWPANHTGWQLQAQTNTLGVGISTNWVNVSGSTGTNQVIVPINLTNGSVFYRLTY